MNKPALLVFLPLVLVALPVSLAAEPFIPEQDARILERLPDPSADPAMRELRRLRAELSRDPRSLELALGFARRAIELGRREGDPRYYGYAQAALSPWWDQAQPPPEVLMLRATLRQNRHDFESALADLEQVLRQRPRWPHAWLTRAIVLTVQGDHPEALRSCRPLGRLSNALVAAACVSHVASLSGRAEASYELLRQALERSLGARLEERLWALTTLAEIAHRRGRHQAAEEHFRQALDLGVRDLYLLAAFADFLLDLDRPRQVRTLLQGEVRSDALLLRLALAEQRLASPRLENHVAILQARFAALRRRGETTHLGSEARFTLDLLHQPREALRLAVRNWAVQREPIDARLVLEAALAAGDSEAARPVLEWLAQTGLEDVRLADLVKEISP